MLKKIKKKLLLKTDRDKVPQQRRIKIKNLKWRNKDLRKLLTRETMRLKLKTMLSSKIHRRLVSLKDSKSITNLPSISSLAFLLLLLWELPCLLSPYSWLQHSLLCLKATPTLLSKSCLNQSLDQRLMSNAFTWSWLLLLLSFLVTYRSSCLESSLKTLLLELELLFTKTCFKSILDGLMTKKTRLGL